MAFYRHDFRESHSSQMPLTAGPLPGEEEDAYRLPLEVQQLGLTSYDPDLGLDLMGANPISSSILLDEAEERILRYGFNVSEKRRTVHTISAEVGDDEIDVNDNIIYTGLLPVFHQKLGMQVSEEDTSISSRYANFTEDLVILPDSYYQTYHNARNRNDFRDMSYIDICKIRLAIDIRPMRMNHSSTNDGKASMVGRRQAWIPPGRQRARYDVFSLFQDIHLGLMRDKKFAYIPESLGGYGKRAPFSYSPNVERFIKSFRQGTHARLVRSIIQRCIGWYKSFSDGKNPGPDPLLAFVSRFTSGFHDWIKGQSIYAPVTWIGVPPETAAYKVNLNSRVPLERDVISRLLAEDYLVPESKVQIVHEHNEFCSRLLEAVNVLEVRELISSKRKEWMNNSSIFSMEAYGYIKEISLENEGHKPLIDIECMAFEKMVADQSLFNLKLQLRDEPVYDRRVLDDLYSRGPMKVRFNAFPRYQGHVLFAHQNFRSNVIDTEEIGEAEAIYEWLQTRIGTPPRKLLNDDNFIIQDILDSRERYHCIVTEDKRLCRLANLKTGEPIFRVPVEWYYRHLYFGESPESPWENYLLGKTGRNWESHLDDGSIRSFEEQYFKDGMPSSKIIRQRFSLLRQERHSTPIEVEEMTVFDDRPPDIRPDTLFYDRRDELGLKRSKQFS
jgi:hypothetical protein